MKKNLLLTDEILFDAKPDAVPYNYRISYKMAQLCLIISMCCGRGGCSIFKLHMISVGLCTKDDMEELVAFAEDRLTSYTLIRFDPAVNRAIKYAITESLIFQQQNGLFRLTEKGKSLVKKIHNIEDLMVNEKSILTSLSNKLTEDKIKALISYWRYSNVKN
ncbi:hypothetical protein [Sporomusa malonica]|uniref:Uncharacterized protein n=1 Tax=Sporomusa malonica TaxID=112901 RepID=A0A1W2F3D4_9FIRM|nr:hypothetical protein [Sporomusa malonica]SMD16473.1 hypothetical protein SAMN04488500_14310 [Sporomusa malonica]